MKQIQLLLITPYLNTRAFVHHGAPEGCRLGAVPPSEAPSLILRREAVAGLVPVAGLPYLHGQAEYLGAYGIACPGPAASVLLFSKRPFEQLDGACCVALTTDSMTSVRLLFLLLARTRGTCDLPTAVAPGTRADAELIIGDQALIRSQSVDGLLIYDLADLWIRSYGLPMVFARWVIRRDVSRALRARLELWLRAFALNESDLLDRTAAENHGLAGLDAATARHYLTGIRTILGDDDLAGQRLYERELQAMNWLPFATQYEPEPITSIEA